jgi:hypothetical protein
MPMVPKGFWEVKASKFRYIGTWRWPYGRLVLIFRGWVDPGHMEWSDAKSPVTQPGIDPGIFRLVAQCLNHYVTLGPYHQEVAMYKCGRGLGSRPADVRLRRAARTNCHIYTLLLPDDRLLTRPKHVEVWWINKVKVNSAIGWLHYTHILRCTLNIT